MDKITKASKNIIAIVGFVNEYRRAIYNSAGILTNKKVIYIYNKRSLPNYGVFDEKRYFKPGFENALLKAKNFSFVVNICEDIWIPEDIASRRLLEQANFLINISASPYHFNKMKERRSILVKKVKKIKIPIIYCNLIGGQDELVFDGRSVMFSKTGKLIGEAKAFTEDLLAVDLPIDSGRKAARSPKAKIVAIDYRSIRKDKVLPSPEVKHMSSVEEVYRALILGVRDYVRKNNFNKVTLGLSGGIDSALVACIAVDALGKANVLAITMPSRYSSSATQGDAEKLSRNLGIRFAKIPISDIFGAYTDTLRDHFSGMGADITEENIQARIRGNILMAFSNKFSSLVLNTGNKSETSVGYCTLYGDMAGGFAVIKDVPKNLVYRLARFINNIRNRKIIPESIFKRAPSAELKPDQKDQDTLPSYGLLDKIIDLYIEKNKSFDEIVKDVGRKDIVKKVLRMVDINEYKRRQSPPGIKITPKAFGRDRRMPITNKFMEARYERDNK
ncbi:NAD+ synthase [Candidatus Omnitrophota bacterium]